MKHDEQHAEQVERMSRMAPRLQITSASPLDEEQLAAIAARIAKLQGEDVEALPLEAIDAHVDHNLIGGFVVLLEGKRYDFSVKGRLARLSQNMRERSYGEQDLEGLRENLREQAKETELVYQPRLEDIEQRSAEEPAFEGVVDEVGRVVSVADGIAYVEGLPNCQSDELLLFTREASGLAMNLEHDRVGVVLFGKVSDVQVGSLCRRTGQTVTVPVGDALLGRVVDALGHPIDEGGQLQCKSIRPVEFPAASVVDRQPVNQPLYTGITAIDAMTPIGRGQRELIIGDRQTGKTAIAIDCILNQKGRDVLCIYVAIGQKMSTLSAVVATLQRHGAMDYTVVVAAGAADSASMQYIAPYSGTAMAEHWMYEKHRDVLVIYDDLTKHAQAYRNLSLLLRRPPGREAYPGDVFYLHSRLLERSARLSEELGGGSITSLPIVETQSGDISAYIPTNVISITDGQIYLESQLFFSGQRPAINVGLSVSRVGGDAQETAMKKTAGSLRINLAQYNEIASFAQFGSDLDPETQEQLKKGESLNEVLKQGQFSPRSMARSVVMLYLATTGILAKLEREDIHPFLTAFDKYLMAIHPKLYARIEESGQFSDEDKALLEEASTTYLPQWQQEQDFDAAEV